VSSVVCELQEIPCSDSVIEMGTESFGGWVCLVTVSCSCCMHMIPVLRRREIALILSRLLQLTVALPRDHAAIAFLDVGVGFAGRADHSCQ
jgi:hypothetical protein